LSKPENTALVSKDDLGNYANQIHGKLLEVIPLITDMEKLKNNYVKLTQEEKGLLITDARIEEYRKITSEKIKNTLGFRGGMETLMRLRKSFSADPVMVSMYPNYFADFTAKILETASKPADTLYPSFKIDLEYMASRPLNEVKGFVDRVSKNTVLKPEQKIYLSSEAKKTALLHIYGEYPSTEKTNELKTMLLKEKWLEPEGSEILFDYYFSRERDEISANYFNNLNEGKVVYDNIKNSKEYSEKLKSALIGDLRRKIVSDLYGDQPSDSQIEELDKLLKTTDWLNPEARDIYWQYMGKKEVLKLQGGHFSSLEEADQLIKNLLADNSRPQAYKDQLFGIIRSKVVKDVYGENPSLDDIESLNFKLIQYRWLVPEGQEVYFGYKNDSKNSFSGTLISADSTASYRYEVERHEDEPDYQVKIFKLNPKNMIYSTRADVHLQDDNTIVVDLLYYQAKPPYWLKLNGNFLKITYPKNGDSFTVEKVGGKFNEQPETQKHGHKKAYLMAKEENGFSEKAAIRAALKYFTFVFREMMLP
jgi:hypothetical protein